MIKLIKNQNIPSLLACLANRVNANSANDDLVNIKA